MKKFFTVVLSLTVALSVGIAFVNCGDDGGCDKTCGTCETLDADACVCNTVEPDCGTRECGDAPNGCGTCGTCETNELCNDGVCEVDTCCPGEGEYAINIAGVVINFPPSNPPAPAQVALTPVAAFEALGSTTPTHLGDTTSDATGSYTSPCFDATNVALGILMLADDVGFDGTIGNYYPTYSGVLSISDNDDKVCMPTGTTSTPTAFAMPNAMVTALSGVPGLTDIATNGFGVVLIVDATQTPVAGAVLKNEDGTDITTNAVIYPNATFTDFAGTETSANGVVLVAGPMTLTNVKPEATGHTWEAEPMAIVAGFCLTRPFLANE